MSKNEKIAVFIGVSLALVFFIFFGMSGLSSSLDFSNGENVGGDVLENEEVTERLNEGEVFIDDLLVGSGVEALSGSRVTVHYVGTLVNGTEFDSSIDKGTPFSFFLGEGDVIEGWDIGLVGMREGGVRRIVIPPELGYGSIQAGPIPPNSILIFEIELLDVEN